MSGPVIVTADELEECFRAAALGGRRLDISPAGDLVLYELYHLPRPTLRVIAEIVTQAIAHRHVTGIAFGSTKGKTNDAV